MKKSIVTFLFSTLLLAFTSNVSVAQTGYKTALGLGIDFGDGSTLVGPQIKHFFTPNNALQGEVLFGNGATFIQGFYQYHAPINGAGGLKWYLGGGPSVALYDGGSDFYLRPMAGLDFKIPAAPIALAFDWRPTIYLGDGGGNNFEPARFGLGFRFTF